MPPSSNREYKDYTLNIDKLAQNSRNITDKSLSDRENLKHPSKKIVRANYFGDYERNSLPMISTN